MRSPTEDFTVLPPALVRGFRWYADKTRLPEMPHAHGYPGSDALRGVTPEEHGFIYVQVVRPAGCIFNDKLVFKSTDGGLSWTDTISPPDTGCVLRSYSAWGTLLTVIQRHPETLYLGATEDEDG
jgi:hypothetical protein